MYSVRARFKQQQHSGAEVLALYGEMKLQMCLCKKKKHLNLKTNIYFINENVTVSARTINNLKYAKDMQFGSKPQSERTTTTTQ